MNENDLYKYIKANTKEKVGQIIDVFPNWNMIKVDGRLHMDDLPMIMNAFKKYHEIKEQESKSQYIKDITEINNNNGTCLEMVQCLQKHFINNQFFQNVLNNYVTSNDIMLSPLGNPSKTELNEARQIEIILNEIKKIT